jgi:hypothetical protein
MPDVNPIILLFVLTLISYGVIFYIAVQLWRDE